MYLRIEEPTQDIDRCFTRPSPSIGDTKHPPHRWYGPSQCTLALHCTPHSLAHHHKRLDNRLYVTVCLVMPSPPDQRLTARHLLFILSIFSYQKKSQLKPHYCLCHSFHHIDADSCLPSCQPLSSLVQRASIVAAHSLHLRQPLFLAPDTSASFAVKSSPRLHASSGLLHTA